MKGTESDSPTQKITLMALDKGEEAFFFFFFFFFFLRCFFKARRSSNITNVRARPRMLLHRARVTLSNLLRLRTLI
jgi:hypothetical protein